MLAMKLGRYLECGQLTSIWKKHLKVVESDRIYYKCSSGPGQLAQRVVPRLVGHSGVPLVWLLLWFVRQGLTILGYARYEGLLDTPLKRMLLGIEVIPEQIRFEFCLVGFSATFLSLLSLVYQVCCPLNRLTFLSIFVCHPDGSIKPSNLKLYKQDSNKFEKIRKHTEDLYQYLLVTICLISVFLWFLLSIVCGAFQVSFILGIFNCISIFFYLCSTTPGKKLLFFENQKLKIFFCKKSLR